jgi:hypothetical protein
VGTELAVVVVVAGKRNTDGLKQNGVAAANRTGVDPTILARELTDRSGVAGSRQGVRSPRSIVFRILWRQTHRNRFRSRQQLTHPPQHVVLFYARVLSISPIRRFLDEGHVR